MQKALINIITLFLLITIGHPLNAQQIILTNDKGEERPDESFTITREQFTVVPEGLLPALKNNLGQWIPSQADDLTGNGEWDELAFIHSFQPDETVTLTVEWVPKDSYPQFTPRTNVRYGKMISPGNVVILPEDTHGKYNLPRGEGYPHQTDGPAWENDKMGFRHYFDGRNVRDVFGKRTSMMVMDTVGIQADGTPGDTYHELRWWGRDIMSGASALGLGGIALQTPDSLIRLGIKMEETTDNVDLTRYSLVVNGPIRSIFKLDFEGWEVNGEKINIYETMTIWAGKYGYENMIHTTPLPLGSKLVTGIVNNFNERPYIREKAGNYEIMSTHDRQTYDKVWYMGMSLLINEDNWEDTFEAPQTGNGITTSWCVALDPDQKGEYRYHCCAAWELTDNRFTDREFYMDMIRQYACQISDGITPVLIQ